MNRRTLVAALCIIEAAVLIAIVRTTAMIDWDSVLAMAPLAFPTRQG